MKIFRNNSPLWSAIIVVALLFLIVQNLYVDHHYSREHSPKNFPENKTIFFTVKEHQFTFRKRGFDTLLDSLKLWKYDKKTDTVYLREESLMPSKYTPLLVIYDKGYDSYEKQENIVPISSFPFSLKNSGSSLQINQVDKDGTVYFKYLDKDLSLKAGKTYNLPYFDGFQLKWVTIKNHGLFDTKQFKTFKKDIDSES